jgi:hypothetical protein
LILWTIAKSWSNAEGNWQGEKLRTGSHTLAGRSECQACLFWIQENIGALKFIENAPIVHLAGIVLSQALEQSAQCQWTPGQNARVHG